MDKERFNADELITGTAIVAAIILEEPDLDEHIIDIALSVAYEKDIDAADWERRTRHLLELAIRAKA